MRKHRHVRYETLDQFSCMPPNGRRSQENRLRSVHAETLGHVPYSSYKVLGCPRFDGKIAPLIRGVNCVCHHLLDLSIKCHQIKSIVILQILVNNEASQPLPRKLVITTRDLDNAPQFAVTITQWNLVPTFDAQTFTFTPPDGAAKIEFLQR